MPFACLVLTLFIHNGYWIVVKMVNYSQKQLIYLHVIEMKSKRGTRNDLTAGAPFRSRQDSSLSSSYDKRKNNNSNLSTPSSISFTRQSTGGFNVDQTVLVCSLARWCVRNDRFLSARFSKTIRLVCVAHQGPAHPRHRSFLNTHYHPSRY